jgi:hypothetical protein
MIQLEKEIQEMQEKMKTLRQQKQETQDKLTHTMIEKQWQQKKIDVGMYHMCMAERKQYSSLTFGYLEEMLPKLISDKAQVQYVIQYLKSQREVKTIPEIRFLTKKAEK